MKKYAAFVEFDGKKMYIEKEGYDSVKEFKRELRANGFKVSFACLAENYDTYADKLHARRERRNAINRYVRQEMKKYR